MQTSVEITASTVEEAIEQGLQQLGVESSQVIVEVIEEPSRGLFGLGSKQARVRLQMIAPPPPKAGQEPPRQSTVISTPIVEDPPPDVSPEQHGDDDDFFDEDGSYGSDEVETRKASTEKPAKPERSKAAKSDEDGSRQKGDKRERRSGKSDRRRGSRGGGRSRDRGTSQESNVETPPISYEEGAPDYEIADKMLNEMLEIMHIDVDVASYRAEASDSDDGQEPPWVLNIQNGDEQLFGDLIGRRGETLTALQYITRLMVSKHTESHANVIVDVDGYRDNRSEKLEKLAHRMADQAVETNRTVTMEPMPPHERRIIHMVLRNRDDVETESKGQGDERRVTIIPHRDPVR